MSASHRRNATAILYALQCGRRGCPCAASFRRGRGATRCPNHPDEHPSFSVGEKDETALVHCHAGCSQEDIIAALRQRGLWPTRRMGGSGRRSAGGAVTRWTYVSADGEVLAVHCRRDRPDGSKVMWWETADGDTSHGDIHPSALPLYRVPDVVRAPMGVWILLHEGEKAAEAGRVLGFVSTTLAGDGPTRLR